MSASPKPIGIYFEPQLEKVGVDFFLLQASPQLEEMERFSESVIQVLA